jgi:hypothetical protein
MVAKTFNVVQLKELVLNSSFVPFLLIWITHGIGGWGISFVLPTVIYDLGISDTARTQLITMPPYTFVFIILLTLGWFIHTKRLNSWIVGLGLEAAQIVCYIFLITVKNKEAKYVFVMIATAASQSFFPIIWPGELISWGGNWVYIDLLSERIRAAYGTTTAGLAIGLTNAMAQLMGIVVSLVLLFLSRALVQLS